MALRRLVLRWVVGLAASVVAIVCLLRFGAEWTPIIVPWRSPLFWGAILVYMASHAAMATRWKVLIEAAHIGCDDPKKVRPELRWTSVLRVSLVHNLVQNLVPARLGEAAFPVLCRRWLRRDPWRSTGALAAGRVMDLVVFPAVCVPALLLGPGPAWMVPAATALGTIGIVAIWVFWKVASRTGRTWPAPVAKMCAAIRGMNVPSARRALAFTSMTVSLRFLSIALIVLAWLPTVAPENAAFVAAAFMVIAALPIAGPAGIGTMELAFFLPLVAIGAGQGVATATSIGLHGVFLAAATCLGLLALAMSRGSGPTDRRGAAGIRFPRLGWLGLVLILAAGLRLMGVAYGLPHMFHPDEAHEVFRALRLGAGGFDFDLHRTLKGGLYYLLFVEYAVFGALALVAGVFRQPSDLGHLLANDPTIPWILGRLTVAAFGVATVWICARGRWGRDMAGAFAATLLAVSFLHVRESQVIGLDVPLAFLALATLWTSVRVAEGKPLHLVTGLLFGAAVATKITGAALLFPVVLAHRLGKCGHRALLVTLVSALGVYLAANPGIFVNGPLIVDYLLGSFTGNNAPIEFQVAMVGGRTGPFFYWEALHLALGWIGALLCLWGGVVAARRREVPDLLLLSFVVPYAIVICTSQTVAVHRYLVPLLPALVILGGRALALPQRWAWPLVLVAAIEPGIRSVRHSVEAMVGDTRHQALAWIESNVPEGSILLIEGNATFPAAQTVPVAVSPEHLVTRAEAYESIDPGKATYLREFAIPAARSVERPTYFPRYIDPENPAAAFDEPIRWAVLSDRIADGFRSKEAFEVWPETAALYESLYREGRSVARFDPQPWHRSGPGITIIELSSTDGVRVMEASLAEIR